MIPSPQVGQGGRFSVPQTSEVAPGWTLRNVSSSPPEQESQPCGEKNTAPVGP